MNNFLKNNPNLVKAIFGKNSGLNFGERVARLGEMLTMIGADATKGAYAGFNHQAPPEEERAEVDEEAYVKGVEEGLSEYIDNIKKSLGIDEDAAVEIKEDENGEIEVNADTDGDGEVDTKVTEEKSETEVENGEKTTSEEVVEENEEYEVDPELHKELEEYLNK